MLRMLPSLGSLLETIMKASEFHIHSNQKLRRLGVKDGDNTSKGLIPEVRWTIPAYLRIVSNGRHECVSPILSSKSSQWQCPARIVEKLDCGDVIGPGN